MTGLEKLAAQLQDLSAGPVSGSAKMDITRLLSDCWNEFGGAADSRMAYWKIIRDEGPQRMMWSPPRLSFTIERHGGIVQGSTRAEKQEWVLDIEKKTARQEIIGFRQVYPRARVLNVNAIADDVCKAVLGGPGVESPLASQGVLFWTADSEIVLKHAKLIPNDGFQQTIAGRRKRFRTDLESKMDALGWELIATGRSLTFKRK